MNTPATGASVQSPQQNLKGKEDPENQELHAAHRAGGTEAHSPQQKKGSILPYQGMDPTTSLLFAPPTVPEI